MPPPPDSPPEDPPPEDSPREDSPPEGSPPEGSPPEDAPPDDVASDLASQVDDALASLWVGDSAAFARLLADDSLSGEEVGKVLKGLAGADAPEPASALQPEEAQARGYRIIREIGRGGMGVVYEAMQEGTKRIVAVKIMLAGPFASDAARRRFEREVELAARLQHPGIVRILESGLLSSGQRYFAMDYVDGVTLDRYLQIARPDARQILKLFTELCNAVDHAHQHDVIHRDLKPGNVLTDQEGRPHILDFGLAKAAGHTGSETITAEVSSPGQVLGTLRYLSPEQAAGEPERIDTRTDIYALGVILFESLTGEAPFDTSGRPSEVIQRIAEAPPASPSSLSRQVDGELETIILKALEKEPDRRFQSAREFADDVRRYLAGEPIQARRASSLYVLRKKLSRHRRAYVAVAGAVILLIAGWMGSAWLDHRQYLRGRAEALRIQVGLEAGRAELLIGPAESLYTQYRHLPEAHLVLAQAQFRMARNRGSDVWKEAADQLLHRSLNADPPLTACASLLAETGTVVTDAESLMLLQQALEAAQNDAEVWYVWSFATLDLETAASRAESAVQAGPEHKLAWERLARLRNQLGDIAGAVAAAEQLIELGEPPNKWRMFEGQVYARHGQYEKAIDVYSRIIQSNPHSMDAFRSRSVARLCLGDYAASAEDGTMVVQLDHSTGDWSRYRRATPLWITGRLEEAADDYRYFRTTKSYATYADARLFILLHDQARLLANQGDAASVAQLQEEAAAVLEAAHDNTPAGSWLNRILACLKGDITPAELTLAANPSSPEQICEAYYYAAEKCLIDGDIERACHWFGECVGTDLVFDLDSTALDPMNEYHLALWRKRSRCPQGAESTSD